MGILDTIVPQPVGTATNNRRANREDLPEAQIWVNLGAGNEGDFTSLPRGIPLDTMADADERGQNEEWVVGQKRRNKLKRDLLAIGATLEPGEEREVMMRVFIRRIKTPLPVAKQAVDVDFTSLLLRG